MFTTLRYVLYSLQLRRIKDGCVTTATTFITSERRWEIVGWRGHTRRHVVETGVRHKNRKRKFVDQNSRVHSTEPRSTQRKYGTDQPQGAAEERPGLFHHEASGVPVVDDSGAGGGTGRGRQLAGGDGAGAAARGRRRREPDGQRATPGAPRLRPVGSLPAGGRRRDDQLPAGRTLVRLLARSHRLRAAPHRPRRPPTVSRREFQRY